VFFCDSCWVKVFRNFRPASTNAGQNQSRGIRRATVHFLRVQEEMPVNWMKEKPPVPLWLAVIYCVTFFGPLWHTLRGIFRDGDARWLWYLLACPASVLGNAWGVLTYKQRGQDKKLIAELQVKQEFKK